MKQPGLLIKKSPKLYQTLCALVEGTKGADEKALAALKQAGALDEDGKATDAAIRTWRKWRSEDLEGALFSQIAAAGLPAPIRQAAIIPGRSYAWDFCWPEDRVVLDVQGGQFRGGGHQTAGGLENDCIKLALTVLLTDYHPLTVTTNMVNDGRALEIVRAALTNQTAAIQNMKPKARAKRKTS